MDSLSERVATFLHKAPARGYCFRCLGTALDAPERELRRVAQPLILQGGFRVGEAACYRCRHADTLVLFNPFAHPVCGLCRRPILPAAAKTTVYAVSYHAGCWARKARESRRT
jgi:hypothetical protein